MTRQVRDLTILIADDQPDVVGLVRALLEWEGYAVIEAADGTDALVQAQTQKPDLIVMDVRMPKMSGLEVLELLRADPALVDIPVVMLSVLTNHPEVRTALERGAVAYLAKPFELPEMARLVEHVLAQDAVGREAIRQNALRKLGVPR
jgi:CheY-like chemotaxis protein